MSPYRKYIFSIAMLFVIPAVILAAMGNDLAWMFGIIGGMLTIGALGMDENLSRAEEEELDRGWEEFHRDLELDKSPNVLLENEIYVDYRDMDETFHDMHAT